MITRFFRIPLLLFLLAIQTSLLAQTPVLSGNNIALSSRNASEKITEGGLLRDHATLQRAFRKTQLDDKLTRVSSYTVLAPTDEAFFDLPSETFNRLLTSGDHRELENTLRYHVLPGKWDSVEIIKALCNDEGMAELPTLHGDTLTLQVVGMRVFLIDSRKRRIEILKDGNAISEKDGIVVLSISRVLTPPVYN